MFCIRLEDDDGFLSYFAGYGPSLNPKYDSNVIHTFDSKEEADEIKNHLNNISAFGGKAINGLLLVLPIKIG